MIVIGTFRHSIELEQALVSLEKIGVPHHQLLVVCMDGESGNSSPQARTSGKPYTKEAEVGFACATGLSVIGTSVGFILPWGPVVCGLLAAFAGFWIGFGLAAAKGSNPKHPKEGPDVAVIVECREEQSSSVREIMWTYDALSVGHAGSAPFPAAR